MQLDEARQWAAQAWCGEKTSGTTMDIDLAEEFAGILATRVAQAVASAEIVQAREVLRRHLTEDAGFRNGYVAAIAMLLNDRFGITDPATRNRAADEILCTLLGA